MGQVARHEKVKLIMGFIFSAEDVLERAELLILKKFGPLDLQSDVIDFLHTDYYKKELGQNLKRKFISLRNLISPENAYLAKLVTNNIEYKLSQNGKRTINIDPGYITLGKLVLLTTKDYSHRVYLKKGIYAESTLRFNKGTYEAREATYPDYKNENYIKTFNEIRDLYKKQLAMV